MSDLPKDAGCPVAYFFGTDPDENSIRTANDDQPVLPDRGRGLSDPVARQVIVAASRIR
jgi:hypothetical protein